MCIAALIALIQLFDKRLFKKLLNNTIMHLVKCGMSLSEYVPDSAHVEGPQRYIFSWRDYRAEYQSVYPSNVCSSGGVPDYIDVAARLYIILNKSTLSFKLMMNYYIQFYDSYETFVIRFQCNSTSICFCTCLREIGKICYNESHAL